jgi:hypothetical protein
VGRVALFILEGGMLIYSVWWNGELKEIDTHKTNDDKWVASVYLKLDKSLSETADTEEQAISEVLYTLSRLDKEETGVH